MTALDDPHSNPELVRKLSQEAWDWVFRMTSGDATDADMTALRTWCARSPLHAREYARVSRRWRALGPAVEDMARQYLADHPGRPADFLPRRRAVLVGGAAVAAAGAAVMVLRPPLELWPSLSEWRADYRTEIGERRQIKLSDAASVELNTRTSLNIRSPGDGRDRIELISGEAIIAARNREIEVIAGNGRTSATLAEFNVRCNGDAIRVTCIEGTVRVNHQGRFVDLQPKQQVVYQAKDSNPGSLGPAKTVDPDVVTGWRQGLLYFEDEPLAHVIEEVNRYRPGRIVLMNAELGRRRYTASFRLDHLEVVVPQLRSAFGARVRQLPGGFVLLG
ncbi:MAG: FecR domain-containing protein [Bradyrhizobium sp.]|nr:FecR domain-containing protein [Bradyrhizobium sp.]